jgi:hypothetical protein
MRSHDTSGGDFVMRRSPTRIAEGLGIADLALLNVHRYRQSVATANVQKVAGSGYRPTAPPSRKLVGQLLGSSIEGEVKRKFFSLDGWSFSCFQPHVMRGEF